ncbi:protein kinase C-binding protein 1-like isoform X2 [Trichogramma pretiosum]|uniref:protein kinase C-binding protein 1-like isoform X2 n=1 Tax=Trichogramma pretiosum TaxID=7493 RepID=UPI0006C96F4B|nr:protein kinase C-binding protein 1-like isoform X2 [Trichogramma pretiosum]
MELNQVNENKSEKSSLNKMEASIQDKQESNDKEMNQNSNNIEPMEVEENSEQSGIKNENEEKIPENANEQLLKIEKINLKQENSQEVEKKNTLDCKIDAFDEKDVNYLKENNVSVSTEKIANIDSKDINHKPKISEVVNSKNDPSKNEVEAYNNIGEQDDLKNEKIEQEKVSNSSKDDSSSEVIEKTNVSPKIESSTSVIETIRKRRTATCKIKVKATKTLTKESHDSTDKVGINQKRFEKGDAYCWRCHKEGVEARCSKCPRSWHRRCMGGAPPLTCADWVCPECLSIERADNCDTRSPAMTLVTTDQLCMMLRHVVSRMRDQAGSEPFCKAVKEEEVPTYLDYVVKPMDLSLLESNVRAKKYKSTEGFMADAKWIQHNCIVFNTCSSKLTNTAKQILKVARQEIWEIEACPDCFAHGRNLQRPLVSWFIEPCQRPHALVWAKLKGFPFWPAKAMPRVNNQGLIDVRFFGEHDRAWVSPKDIFLYSKESPAILGKKKKEEMELVLKEVEEHIGKLEHAFGEFKYAVGKVPYDPHNENQIKAMLPYYDPVLNKRIDSVKSDDSKTRNSKKAMLLLKQNMSPVVVTQKVDKMLPMKPQVALRKEDKKIEQQPEKESIVHTRKVASSPAKRTETGDNKNDKEITPKPGVDIKSRIAVKPLPSLKPNGTIDPHDRTVKVQTRKRKIAELKNSTETPNKKISTTSDADTLVVSPAVSLAPSPKKLKNSLPETNSSENTTDNSLTNPVSSVAAATTISESKSVVKVNNGESQQKRTVAAVRRIGSTGQVKKIRVNHALNPEDLTILKVTGGNIKRRNIIRATPAVNDVSDKNNLYKTVTVTGSGKPKTIFVKKNSSLLSPGNSPKLLLKTAAHISGKRPNEKETVKGMIVRKQSVVEKDPLSISSKPMTSIPVTGKKEGNSIVYYTFKPHVKDNSPKQTHDKESNSTISGVNADNKSDQVKTIGSRKIAKARKSLTTKSVRDSTSSSPTAAAMNQSLQMSKTVVYVAGSPQLTKEKSDSMSKVPPPEAGPISTRLHKYSKELTSRISEMIVNLIEETSEAKTGLADDNEGVIHILKLKMERLKWSHQQEINDLKLQHEQVVRELKSNFEIERFRTLQDARREAEIEKLRCIEETKRKQWCVVCGREAMFYCCWNTAYCDYPCQQKHWNTHLHTCAQKTNSQTLSPQHQRPQSVSPPPVVTQPMPKLVISRPPQQQEQPQPHQTLLVKRN